MIGNDSITLYIFLSLYEESKTFYKCNEKYKYFFHETIASNSLSSYQEFTQYLNSLHRTWEHEPSFYGYIIGQCKDRTYMITDN